MFLLKSQIAKRSVVIAGHKRSISLEESSVEIVKRDSHLPRCELVGPAQQYRIHAT